MEAIYIPELWEIDCEAANNRVRQLRRPAYAGKATIYKLAIGRHEAFRVEASDRTIAVVGKSLTAAPEGEVLVRGTKGKAIVPSATADPATLRWLRPLPTVSLTPAELHARADDVRSSWNGHFVLRAETTDTDGYARPRSEPFTWSSRTGR